MHGRVRRSRDSLPWIQQPVPPRDAGMDATSCDLHKDIDRCRYTN